METKKIIVSEKTFEEMELPETVYKYRVWDNPFHKTIITKQEVFFAAPTSFEDPLDCKNLIRYDLLTDEDIYSYFLMDSKEKYPERTRQQHRAYAREWSKKTPMNDKKYVKERVEQDFKEYDERFGVLSLTANPTNEAMWEKYANNHNGFAIGFNPLIMFPYLGGGGAVSYYDELPIILPRPWHSFEEQHNYQIFAKLSKWSFEEEYRTHMFRPDPLTIQDRTIKLPPEAITKIIIGKNMPQESVDNLIESIPAELSHVQIEYEK